MRENVLKAKSFLFAIRIVKAYRYLVEQKKEHILSRQLVRSATSVGSIVREAEHAESIKDFTHKLSIGLKEINECKYWLDLLFATEYLTKSIYDSLNKDCEELLKLLIASVKTSKKNIK